MPEQLTLPTIPTVVRHDRENHCRDRLSNPWRSDSRSGLDTTWHIWDEETIEQERYFQGMK